ncbi:MAG: right-handed parallel beta-helix repeat-containing protein [Euryarchaeota archaeon]|nr:right-handed parallel beta-helix repeat-containing protein [Euryarchaeota archaeon]
MNRKGRKQKLLIGSISLASAVVLIVASIGSSIFFGLEKATIKDNHDIKTWDIIVPDNYRSIQEAINHADEGYRIFVRSGTYEKPRNVNREGITIHGEDSKTTIINGRDSTAVYIKADSVNFSGFTITNNGVNDSLLMIDADDCSIFNNILLTDNFYDGTEYGISVYSSYNNIFSNNIISNADYGIEIERSDNNIFTNNTIEKNNVGMYVSSNGNVFSNNLLKNNGEGIFISSSEESYILNNMIVNSRQSGVYLSRCLNIVLKNNEFFGAGLGIYGDDVSNFVHEIEGNKVNNKPLYYFRQKNHFTVPSDAGQIILVDCNDVTVEKTVISDTSTALLVAFSENVVIQNNEFSSNYRGVRLSYSYSCSVKQNNFINNTFDAWFDVLGFFNRKSNTWSGNYWDGRIGNNRLILGLLPKKIPGRFHLNTQFKVFDKLGLGYRARSFDRSPAKLPYKII